MHSLPDGCLDDQVRSQARLPCLTFLHAGPHRLAVHPFHRAHPAGPLRLAFRHTCTVPVPLRLLRGAVPPGGPVQWPGPDAPALPRSHPPRGQQGQLLRLPRQTGAVALRRRRVPPVGLLQQGFGVRGWGAQGLRRGVRREEQEEEEREDINRWMILNKSIMRFVLVSSSDELNRRSPRQYVAIRRFDNWEENSIHMVLLLPLQLHATQLHSHQLSETRKTIRDACWKSTVQTLTSRINRRHSLDLKFC